MFEWLSPSHWEVVGQLSEHVHRHLGGTLSWLYSMPELNTWLSRKGPCIFWMTGLPGIGKSIIAAHLVSTLHPAALGDQHDKDTIPKSNRPPPSYVAYFFCRSGEDKLMHAHNIVQTFSYQLARQSDIFRREVNKTRVVEQFTVSSGVGIRLLYNRLIERPLSSVVRTVGIREIICIIDGLDEADFTIRDGRSGNSEIRILLQLLSASPEIRLLVTSRRIKELCDTLDVLPCVSREICSSDNGDDIELYVEWKVSHSAKLRQGFTELSVSPVDHFLNELRCNFLWTDIVLRFLEGSASKSDFESGLYEIPVQFFELYRQILGRITKSATPRKRRFIKEVIRFIIISPRKLRVSELQAFVEETLKDRFFDFLYLLRSECGTFVRIVDFPNDDDRKYVQVAHETFRDFITSDTSSNEEFHVPLPDSHAEIAIILLRYLSTADFGTQLTPGDFSERTDEQAVSILQRFPLLKYAASKWSLHVLQSSKVEELNIAVKEFLTRGPLLLWIETLAIFGQLPVLSRSTDDILKWTQTHTTSDIDSEIFHTWARDITRLCTESSNTLTEYPNCIHNMLFDLFPSPSLFYDRYKSGVATVSGNASVPLNPTLAGVSNFYNLGYYSSAFSTGPREFFALANNEHIRILQTFGGSVFIIPAFPPNGNINTRSKDVSPVRSLSITSSFSLLPANKWVVLAMVFGPSKLGLKNMFAAVHVPLVEGDSPYLPTLSIWDIDELALLTSVQLYSEEVGDKFCLVDWVSFSDDGCFVHCGVWKYDIHRKETTIIGNLGELIDEADAMIVCRDRTHILRMNRNNSRTLINTNTDESVEFTNLPPTNESQMQVEYLLPGESDYRRQESTDLEWWQLWREVTRLYQFSYDSRWFARFTPENSVVLHDLRQQSQITILKPDASWSNILVNNLAFDTDSTRLAWTFNYVANNKAHDTRIELWSIEKMSAICGFSLGRYGWRDRIAFCSNRNHLLTYRTGIATWDILLGIKFQGMRDSNELEGSVISGFPITQYCIRLGYSSRGDVWLLYPEELSQRFILQAFRRRQRVGRKIVFDSAVLGTNHWQFPWTIEDSIGVADTILNISNVDDMRVADSLTLPSNILTTSFHLAKGLLACLEEQESVMALRLFSILDKKEIASTEGNILTEQINA